MKIFRQLLVVVITLTVFGACQKELGFEGGVSVGSLKKSTVTGDCTPVTIFGIFRKDSVLTSSNYVDVEVNVTIAGTFDIKSDTVNGYSFSKTGNVGTASNVIRLYASGKPLAPGINTFTITYGSSVCTFDITVVAATGGTAVYTLGGSPGACALFTPAGTYMTGIPLTAANTVSFNVNVVNPGTYSITTDVPAINGMTFTASGTFINAGVQTVTLVGMGTPTAAGAFTFTPTTGSSTCTFVINVAGGTPAGFTLNGGPAPGTCTGATVSGTYTSGIVLNAGDTVVLGANVTALGTYAINTGTVNNISFSKTGTFTQLGPQTITLAGTGTPNNTAAVTDNFTASAPSVTSCVFSVSLNPPAAAPNADYIPETIGSNWSDKLVGGMASDTTYTQVSTNTTLQGGNTYRIFYITDNSGSVSDSAYHRKNAGLYYGYIYGNYGIFDNPVNSQLLLIDSTLAVNGTWTTSFLGNTIGGTSGDLRIDAKIIAKGLTKVVAGNSYSNVIEVRFTYMLNYMGTGYTHVADEEFFYAKGKGLIDDIQTDFPVTTTTEYQTTRIQIF